MTIGVEVETRIGRPPERVFAELAAIERFPEWLQASGITRVERLDGGPLAIGSKVRIEQRVGGRATVLEGTITKLEPARAFGLRARDRDGVTIEIEAALAPDEAGNGSPTRLRWSLRIALPLRFRVFESMVTPQVQRAATLDLEAFKRRLESVAGN